MIVPIVEGHGEVESVPLLLRDRLLPALSVYDLTVQNRAIRKPRGMILTKDSCEKMLQVAAYTPGASAVLVLFDSDDACARDIIPLLTEWATGAVGHIPSAFVMARREYEAWFLASLESLRGIRGIQEDAAYSDDPEAKRDAKGQIGERMIDKGPYSPTVHQSAFTAKFDLTQAYRRCSSFRKLVKELCRILEATGHTPVIPQEWQASPKQPSGIG